MYQRYLLPHLHAVFQDTPVVLLSGARQTGKSTLVKSLMGELKDPQYFTLDDASVLSVAQHDPAGFLKGLADGTIILDEIQRAPELFIAIKEIVDKQHRPGRFLLTGSANVLLLPKLADSLAGRMEILTLWPLAQQELKNYSYNFIDKIFSDNVNFKDPMSLKREDLIGIICAGGYPEAVRRSEVRRYTWFESYLTTILQRDIREVANIEGLTELPHLLKLLATRHMGLLNLADLSRSIGIAQTTLKRYMTLLEMTFLLSYLPPWYNNLGKQLVKAPKLMFNDTGLVAHLLGLNTKKLMDTSMLLGAILESFVINELRKQASWQDFPVSLFHFRTHVGQEIDIILENRHGELIGIEVKASQTVSMNDFKGLKLLSELTMDRFKYGFVLYTGERVIPFGEKYYALPVNLLWDS